MCMYVYVCVFVSVWGLMYVSVCDGDCVRVTVCKCVCVCFCVYLCKSVNVCLSPYVCVYVRICVVVCLYGCVSQ